MGKNKYRSRSKTDSNLPSSVGRSNQRRSKRSRSREDKDKTSKRKRSRDKKPRKEKHARKYSSSSSNKSSSDIHSSEPSQEKVNEPITEGQRLYQERKRQRRMEEEKTTAAILQGIEGELNLRKVDISDFQNYKRKLVILNIPNDVTKDEINDYFFTVLQS